MPPSRPPSLRQQRLGAELRKLRERVGLSSTQAAAGLGVQQARMSMIEAGRYAVSADRVRAMAHSYACADPALIDALAEMTGGRTRGWWDEYRDILPAGLQDLAELEHYATTMRIASIVHIPGLLQTSEHARAVFREVVPPRAAHEVEHRVSYRIKRQAALYGEQCKRTTAILHEAALHMGFGGRNTAQKQLRHLIEMGDRGNVNLVVIPFGGGVFPGSGQPVVYAAGPVVQLDTVQLDTEHGMEFLDAEAQLTKYRSVLDRMEACALKPEESQDLIHRIAQEV